MSRLGAALLLLLAAAGSAAGQYVEPFPRKAGVAPPEEWLSKLEAEAARLGIPAPGRLLAPAAVERFGQRTILIVPALFADSPEPSFAPSEIQTLLFDGPSPRGTIGEYYSDQSGGLFTIGGEVAPWVRTSITLDAATGDDGTGPRLRDYVREAVSLADDSIDFGLFDNDGSDGVPNSGDDDGTVDGIVIQFLEVAASCGGPGIWPHLSGLFGPDGQPFQTDDLGPGGQPILVQVYIADSAVDCGGAELQGPEVLAHELGHLIGLPDYYRAVDGIQPWQRHWTVGCFDLMGSGAWGCGQGGKIDGFGPTGLSALSRAALGWATLDMIDTVADTVVELAPLGDGRRALQIPLTWDGQETFILEYRTQEGYDADLPAGGVVVYHTDEGSPSRWIPAGLPPAYRYHLVEADGDDALRKVEADGGNRGVEADLFARNGATDSIMDGTAPSTRDHLGRPTRVRIPEIRIEGGVARVRISTAAGPVVSARFLPVTVEGGRVFGSQSRVGGAVLPLVAEPLAGGLPPGFQLQVVDSIVFVNGTITSAEPFRVSFRIRDAAGGEVVEHLSTLVTDPTILEQRLADAAAGLAARVSEEEALYLDSAGNDNGRFDVADARASMLRRGLLYRR